MAYEWPDAARDVREVVTTNGTRAHLAAVASGGGLYATTLCGEPVRHGYDREHADPLELCRACAGIVAGAGVPDRLAGAPVIAAIRRSEARPPAAGASKGKRNGNGAAKSTPAPDAGEAPEPDGEPIPAGTPDNDAPAGENPL